jgi:(p)ppGpp synthase/HD superfamily hydrolase
MGANAIDPQPFDKVNRIYCTMNTNNELLERAVQIAAKAHAGQKDKYGAPYLLHPLRVMDRVRTLPEKIVAVLHDVVEDTSWTFDDLRGEGFPEEIIAALKCVTKRANEDYEEFVRRSASNSLARRVKIADLEDNMDLRRLESVTEQDVPRLEKYLKAWRQLSAEAQ